MSTECITGCRARGQHEPSCEGGACKGCLPRIAEHGLLCAWDWQRLSADILHAPELVHHLRAEAEPHAGAKPAGDGRSHRDPAEASILSAAVDAADEIHAALASWAHLILEEHPNGEHMAGPDERGVVRTWDTWARNEYGVYPRPSRVAGVKTGVVDPASNGLAPVYVEQVCVAPILDSAGKPILYAVMVRPAQPAPDPTGALVAWLMPLLPWCAEQEWIAVMRSELGALIRTTSARWPVEDRSRVLHEVCEMCQTLGVRFTPPSAHMATATYVCTNPECAWQWTDAGWEAMQARTSERIGA